jgi:hypothetical protein
MTNKRICERTLSAFKDFDNSELKDLPLICMKNYDIGGNGIVFGIITRTLIQEKFNLVITDRDTNNEYLYYDAEELVNAGWMVD